MPQNKPSKKEIRKDLGEMNALNAVKNSEGGKIIIKRSLADILSTLDSLASGYPILSHIQLVSLCARLKERLDIYRALNNSDANIQLAEEALEEALKEDPDL